MEDGSVEQRKTKIARKTRNPAWNQAFVFNVRRGLVSARFHVHNKSTKPHLVHTCQGECQLDLVLRNRLTRPRSYWIPLQNCAGLLHVKLETWDSIREMEQRKKNKAQLSQRRAGSGEGRASSSNSKPNELSSGQRKFLPENSESTQISKGSLSTDEDAVISPEDVGPSLRRTLSPGPLEASEASSHPSVTLPIAKPRQLGPRTPSIEVLPDEVKDKMFTTPQTPLSSPKISRYAPFDSEDERSEGNLKIVSSDFNPTISPKIRQPKLMLPYTDDQKEQGPLEIISSDVALQLAEIRHAIGLHEKNTKSMINKDARNNRGRFQLIENKHERLYRELKDIREATPHMASWRELKDRQESMNEAIRRIQERLDKIERRLPENVTTVAAEGIASGFVDYFFQGLLVLFYAFAQVLGILFGQDTDTRDREVDDNF
ncbi:hypothetical protein AAMO2058_000256600 [Amorphochlora amoebiformis]